jgi:hypothetical protein
LLICSGGVSGSDADHVLSSVLAAGGSCEKVSLALKPGKPPAMGRIGAMAVLGLPGNPVVALVGALLFARPMPQTLAGYFAPAHATVMAKAGSTFSHRLGRTEFVPVGVWVTIREELRYWRSLDEEGQRGCAPWFSPMVSAAFPLRSTTCRPERHCRITHSEQLLIFRRSRLDNFAVFLHKPPNLRVRKQGENGLGRAAKLHAFVRHNNGAVDKDRMSEHLVDQLIVGQIWV